MAHITIILKSNATNTLFCNKLFHTSRNHYHILSTRESRLQMFTNSMEWINNTLKCDMQRCLVKFEKMFQLLYHHLHLILTFHLPINPVDLTIIFTLPTTLVYFITQHTVQHTLTYMKLFSNASKNIWFKWYIIHNTVCLGSIWQRAESISTAIYSVRKFW